MYLSKYQFIYKILKKKKELFCYLRYNFFLFHLLRPFGRPKKKPRGKSTGRPEAIDVNTTSRNTKKKFAINLLNKTKDPTVRKHMLLILQQEADENKKNKKVKADTTLKRHTPESAAIFFLKGNFSERTWELLVTDSRAMNAKIYPGYRAVQSRFHPNIYKLHITFL